MRVGLWKKIGLQRRLLERPLNDYPVWLDRGKREPAELAYLYEPFPASEMKAVAVSQVVNNARNEVAECVEPCNSL